MNINRRRFLQIAAAVPAMPLADMIIEAAKPKVFYSIPENPALYMPKIWTLDEVTQAARNIFESDVIDSMGYAMMVSNPPGFDWSQLGQPGDVRDVFALNGYKRGSFRIPAMRYVQWDNPSKNWIPIKDELTGASVRDVDWGNVVRHFHEQNRSWLARAEEITIEEMRRRYPPGPRKLKDVMWDDGATITAGRSLDELAAAPAQVEKSIESLRSIGEGLVNGVRRIVEAIS